MSASGRPRVGAVDPIGALLLISLAMLAAETATAGACDDPKVFVTPPDAGLVDVTQPPYLAVPDDGLDDTATIQQALQDHPNANRVIYLRQRKQATAAGPVHATGVDARRRDAWRPRSVGSMARSSGIADRRRRVVDAGYAGVATRVRSTGACACGLRVPGDAHAMAVRCGQGSDRQPGTQPPRHPRHGRRGEGASDARRRRRVGWRSGVLFLCASGVGCLAGHARGVPTA